jgi:hypothetical protein
MTGLEEGIKAAQLYSERTLPQIVNISAYYIALDARDQTRFVDVGRIDAELSTMVEPVYGRSGKVLKSKKMYAALANVRIAKGRMAGKLVPLAALIIQKMVGSYEFLRGDERYPLSHSPFKGFNRALGAQKMAYYIDKLIKGRHSSTHYLASGWTPVVEALKRCCGNFIKGGRVHYAGLNNPELGYAKPATENDATCTIENLVGEKGEHAERANEQLHLIAGPALQRAVDNEGVKQMQYALDHANKELAATVNPLWK